MNTEDFTQNQLRAIEGLRCHRESPDELLFLWRAVAALEGHMFQTSGRGSRPGVTFTYVVSRVADRRGGGRLYEGENVDGYGNELWIVVNGVKRERSISRSTVELGYKRAVELGTVSGPKALGLPGSGSYLFPLFLTLGICEKGTREKNNDHPVIEQLSLSE